MKQHSNTTASTSSSGDSSSTPPNPQPHGLRTQLGHLLPRHAVFQVHLHIEQLSNVPLIKGEFGVRWKFKNVQSGSGLLSKMKAHRTLSGQGQGKGKGRADAGGDADSGDGLERDSTHSAAADTTEDDRSAAESPRSPTDADAHRAFGFLHPPAAPTPIAASPSAGSLSAAPLQTESRGTTPWARLQSYNVKWEHTVNVAVQMDVHRETGDLLPSELKLVVLQVSPLISASGTVMGPRATGMLSARLLPPSITRRGVPREAAIPGVSNVRSVVGNHAPALRCAPTVATGNGNLVG